MELNVRDVARLLKVSERTVHRWVRNGSLPSHRVHDQHRFNPVELQEWALAHGQPLPPRLLEPEESSRDPETFHAALERGGIFHGVPGGSREEVLKAVANLPGIPASVDRRLLDELLVARERLAPTAVGEGIAIPHPRDPVVVPTEQPLVLLALLRRPVDFRALDGRPVQVLFLLLSPSVRQHLRMFARLAFALHDETLKRLLRDAASRESILDRIRVVESGEARAGASGSVDAPALARR